MKSFYYFMLCAAFMLTACENEEGNGGGNKEVTLTDNTPEEIVVKADDNGNGQAIKFKAVAPWTATVKDVTPARSEAKDEVEWVKLSAYSGEAGDVSLSLSFTKNFTGVTRKAEIIIQCGDTVIKISIEQVAENTDGTVTKQIKTITGRWEYNSEIINDPEVSPISEETITYSYDDQGRVVRVLNTDDDEGSTDSYETIYDYTVVDEIQITTREYYGGETNETKYIADLNDKGNAVKVRKFVEGKYLDKNTIEYTEDGRVAKIKEYDYYYNNGELEEEIRYTYDKDGYLIKAYAYDRYDSYEDEYTFDIPTFYPNKYPNNSMIDMISLYDDFGFDYESVTMLSTIGRLGKTSEYFIERVVEKDESNFIGSYEDWKQGVTSGQTLDESKSKTVKFSYDTEYSCEYDNDKNLKKITITEKFDIYDVHYKLMVTNDYKEDEFGNKIYRCEGTYTYTKSGTDKDVTTYTFSY